MARPLTKQRKDGSRYVRPALIEQKIDDAVLLNSKDLKEQLAVTDRSAGGYLPSECLVHLMRLARQRDDQEAMSAILPVLLRRCEAILRIKITESRFREPAEVRRDILGDFSELFAIDGSAQDTGRLDFFECRFQKAFATFRLDKAKHERLWAANVTSIAEGEGGDEPFSKLLETLEIAPVQERSAAVMLLKKAILALPDDERNAVLEIHIVGRPEEAVAKKYNCDPRTIRNRLTRAAKKLIGFKEEI